MATNSSSDFTFGNTTGERVTKSSSDFTFGNTVQQARGEIAMALI